MVILSLTELPDSFVQQPHAAGHGHLRARVRGRADDVLRYQGVDIHPHVVRSVLVRSPEILDYRVRQTPGVSHGFTNSGPGPARLVCIHAAPAMTTTWVD